MDEVQVSIVRLSQTFELFVSTTKNGNFGIDLYDIHNRKKKEYTFWPWDGLHLSCLQAQKPFLETSLTNSLSSSQALHVLQCLFFA